MYSETFRMRFDVPSEEYRHGKKYGRNISMFEQFVGPFIRGLLVIEVSLMRILARRGHQLQSLLTDSLSLDTSSLRKWCPVEGKTPRLKVPLDEKVLFFWIQGILDDYGEVSSGLSFSVCWYRASHVNWVDQIWISGTMWSSAGSILSTLVRSVLKVILLWALIEVESWKNDLRSDISLKTIHYQQLHYLTIISLYKFYKGQE